MACEQDLHVSMNHESIVALKLEIDRTAGLLR